MARINLKKLEKIACEKVPDFLNRKNENFCSWAKKHCGSCSNKENLAVCQNWNCEKLKKFYNSGSYLGLFYSLTEYWYLRRKAQGKIYEETSEGFTRKVNSARKEHKCDWCGKTIQVGDPYLSTIDFAARKVWCSCDTCHKTIIWMYGD